MTSATERLRALLDERGVEHFDATECTLWGYEQTSDSTGCYRCAADEVGEGFMTLRMHHITPEQAVAATLGPGTCEVEESWHGESEMVEYRCTACDEYMAVEVVKPDGAQRPNCGRKVVEDRNRERGRYGE